MSNPLLYVNRKDLALAASLLKKIVRPSRGLEVVLKFDGKELQIEAGGGSSSAAAHGVWPGSARVGSAGFLPVLTRLPAGDWVKCEVVSDVLKVGSFAVPCIWRSGSSRPVWLPINPRLADYVAVRLHYSDEDILGAGLWEKVEGALGERDRVVAIAARTLEPLGVTPELLGTFVNDVVLRGFNPDEGQ